jgi:hypothetical protein
MTINMTRKSSAFGAVLTLAVIVAAVFALSIAAQNKDKGKSDPPAMVKIRIEVTAGEKSAPVDMASVYVRFEIKHFLGKDEKVEMNIKTNREGVAIAQSVQSGKVLVQVIADGWKPFGYWFDVTEDGQVVKIKLEKPPRWY